MSNPYGENPLVEQPAIALFRELGWETTDCFEERYGPNGDLGRETRAEVMLPQRLRLGAGAAESWRAAASDRSGNRGAEPRSSRDEHGGGQPRGLRSAQERRQSHGSRTGRL